MFEKFGEFNAVEELNNAAAVKKAEGNEEELIVLAMENGLDKEDAEDYMDGYMDELATPVMAAVGKLRVEAADLKLKGILQDWVDELSVMCTESEAFSRAVRSKGKDLAGYIALTADKGYENRAVVDKRIVQRTTDVKKIIGNHEFAIGIPDKKIRRELAVKYYQGQEG